MLPTIRGACSSSRVGDQTVRGACSSSHVGDQTGLCSHFDTTVQLGGSSVQRMCRCRYSREWLPFGCATRDCKRPRASTFSWTPQYLLSAPPRTNSLVLLPLCCYDCVVLTGWGCRGDEPAGHQKRPVPGVHKAGGSAAQPGAEAGEGRGRVMFFLFCFLWRRKEAPALFPRGSSLHVAYRVCLLLSLSRCCEFTTRNGRRRQG